jgi:hypothetical protein
MHNAQQSKEQLHGTMPNTMFSDALQLHDTMSSKCNVKQQMIHLDICTGMSQLLAWIHTA